MSCNEQLLIYVWISASMTLDYFRGDGRITACGTLCMHKRPESREANLRSGHRDRGEEDPCRLSEGK